MLLGCPAPAVGEIGVNDTGDLTEFDRHTLNGSQIVFSADSKQAVGNVKYDTKFMHYSSSFLRNLIFISRFNM